MSKMVDHGMDQVVSQLGDLAVFHNDLAESTKDLSEALSSFRGSYDDRMEEHTEALEKQATAINEWMLLWNATVSAFYSSHQNGIPIYLYGPSETMSVRHPRP